MCNRYHRRQFESRQPSVSEVGENDCKIGTVQDTLATIVRWQLASNTMTALVTATYRSRAATECGCKLLLLQATIAILLILLRVALIYTDHVLLINEVLTSCRTFGVCIRYLQNDIKSAR